MMVIMYFIIICYEGCGVVWYLNIFADGFDRGKGKRITIYPFSSSLPEVDC